MTELDANSMESVRNISFQYALGILHGLSLRLAVIANTGSDTQGVGPEASMYHATEEGDYLLLKDGLQDYAVVLLAPLKKAFHPCAGHPDVNRASPRFLMLRSIPA